MPGGRDAYTRAVDLEGQGEHSAALALLWEASGAAPRDPDIQNRLGEALERIGALEGAVDAYRRAVEARPGFRKAENNLILTLVKAGKGEEAVIRARALVDRTPTDAGRWFTLGLALSEQDVEAALRTFQRVLALEPRHTLARYNLALVLKRADRLPEAIEALQRALEVEQRPEAIYTLGVIYWQQGNTEGALRALRTAVAIDPRHVDGHYTLGAVLASAKEWTKATEALRRAIALRPELPGAHDTLARVLRQSGDSRGASRELAEAERLRNLAALRQEAGVWSAVGSRMLESGDLAGALTAFRRATAALDTYAPAHYQIGLLLQKLGEYEASRAAFARAAELNPGLAAPAAPR